LSSVCKVGFGSNPLFLFFFALVLHINGYKFISAVSSSEMVLTE
jgi:hypothetical protein